MTVKKPFRHDRARVGVFRPHSLNGDSVYRRQTRKQTSWGLDYGVFVKGALLKHLPALLDSSHFLYTICSNQNQHYNNTYHV
jgi:hypothetical protein